MLKKLVHTVCMWFVFSLIGIFSANIYAAGYGLMEQSGSGMGNAFAGAAATAEDASTIYFNPAGMTYLTDKEMSIAVHAIKPTSHFNDAGSQAGAGKPLGNEGGDIGDWAFIPNFYYAMKLSPDFSIGIGINVPFGLKTEYDENWLGRFQAITSEINAININPSIAYQINENFSIGAGVSAMHFEAELNRAANFGAAGEGAATIQGDDWGFGANIGAMIKITPATRIGLAYRSQIKHTLEGTVRFNRPAGIPAVAARNGDVSSEVTLPDSFSISSFSSLNEDWDVMADVTWTGWQKFKALKVVRTTGATLTLLPASWKDTMRYSIGTNYRVNDQLKLRIGVAYDEEAVENNFRTALIPGNDRTWLAFGANYKLSPQTALDIGYAHLFIKDAPINNNQQPANGQIKGKYDSYVDILSMQLTYVF